MTLKNLALELGVTPQSLQKKLSPSRKYDYYKSLIGNDFETGLNSVLPEGLVDLLRNKPAAPKKAAPKKALRRSLLAADSPLDIVIKKEINAETAILKPQNKFDLGVFILGSGNIIFVLVLTLLAYQAFIFSSLATDHLEGINVWIFWVGAMIFEASGIAIAIRDIPTGLTYRQGEEIRKRRMSWVWLFTLIQIATDLCYLKIFEQWDILSNTDKVSRFLIAISIPIGIAAYSYLYMQSKTQDHE